MTALAAVLGPVGSPLFLLHVAGVVLVLALALAGYGARNRSYPGVAWFAAWSACTAAWLAANTAGLLVADPAIRSVVQSVALAVTPLTATAWVAFALEYTGRGELLTRLRLRALVTVAVAVSALAVTNPIHGQVVADVTIRYVAGVQAIPQFEPRAGFWLVTVYVYLLFFWGLVLLVDLAITGDRLYADQAAALLLAVGIPLGIAVAFVSGRFRPSTDVTPLAVAISAAPLAYAVFRSRLLELVPAFHRIGERKALHALDQGVLVLDPADRVVSSNDRMVSILDTDRDAIRGRPVGEVVDESPLEPTSRWLDDPVDGVDESHRRTADRDDPLSSRLRDPRTGRSYSVTESGIEDGDVPMGRAVVVRDVTEERRRKQRLLVLNRVVRHNLRNDMTVLLGHARMLGDGNDASLPVIEEIGSDLVELGEKAQEIDRIVRESTDADRTVDVAGIVERVTDRYRDADVTLDVYLPDQAWTESHGRVIEAIVSNLVENAVEHGSLGIEARPNGGAATHGAAGATRTRAGDAPTPTVTVALERRSDRLELVVADDGPGIPQEELDSIGGGEMSDLHHASGLGLWMVKWCVDLADAHWSIDTECGTRVTVSFPRTDVTSAAEE